MLDGRSRVIKDPGVFFEQSQKAFFIFSGKVFPDLQVDFRVIVIVEVGHIKRNEEG
jgi:hypothetical protein